MATTYSALPDLTVTDTTNSSSSPSNGGNAVASFAPALMSLIGVAGSISDIRDKNSNIRDNIQNQADSLGYLQGSQKQQLEDLNRVLGDKLSSSGLEALKTEARLKAASAETGASGASNQSAINTAEVNKLHRDAALLRSYDVSRANQLQEITASRLGFESRAQSIASGTQSAFSAALQTLNAGLTGMNKGIGLLNQSQKENFFNTNTTGAR